MVVRGVDTGQPVWVGTGLGLVVISAQRNPASSRAMAVTTMLRLDLRASGLRKRRLRRSCAFQARAMTSGGRPLLSLGDGGAEAGAGFVGPRRLDELGA